MATIMDMIARFRVEGVIGDRLVFCDTWNMFHYMLKQEMKEAEIPFLANEREYMPSFMGQFKTRVQAFLETIQE
jgi:benzoyl-CoA reductase/2-hydroxyglutaryl-CoA dehydratase subunit BcrC/BadD/HgdB